MIQSQEEYQIFINQSLINKDGINKKINIGETTEDTRTRLGKNVRNIGIDNDAVIHAYNEKHNLEPDDLLHAAEIINEADNLILSKKQHNQCNVISFVKDLNGEIELLAEIHEQKYFLMIFNAWRKKKVRRRPDAVERPPGTNVLNVTQPTININITQETPDVNKEN